MNEYGSPHSISVCITQISGEWESAVEQGKQLYHFSFLCPISVGSALKEINLLLRASHRFDSVSVTDPIFKVTVGLRHDNLLHL